MAILEALLINVGFSVAKSFIHIWLEDIPVADDTSKTILEIIKSNTQDFLEARQASRQFEELGDKVAKSLMPLFEPYGDEEISYEAITHHISETILESKISNDLLATLNNDPDKLYLHMESAKPVPAGQFSEIEEALIKQALEQVSQAILDIAVTFPDFLSKNITELLIRIEEQGEKIDQILENIEHIRATSNDANPETQDAEFENRYRTEIARKLDRVDILGVDLPKKIKRYQLSVSYVSLQVEELNDNEYYFGITGSEVPVISALQNSHRVSIIGEAGSGKTTLLKWLAVRSALNDFGSDMLDWADTVPFYLELRRYHDAPPSPDNFIEHIVPLLQDRMPMGWVDEALRNGRAILLIDGLDEVTIPNREKIFEWIEDLVYEYPKVKIVLTSRPAAYGGGELADLEFIDYFLAPMQLPEIEQFIMYWHRSVLLEQKIENWDSIYIFSQRLINYIKNNTPLLQLATNPLLCAMICALHYARQMQLPAQRNDLYFACTEMLLERRDVEREIDIADFPRLSYQQKRILLEDLAYWMLKNGYASVGLDSALNRLALKIEGMNFEFDKSKLDPILQLLIERSGIVRIISLDTIDFIHKTFQEYLAASAVRREGDWGLLLDKSDDDQWREVIILAAGFANKEEADKLILGLLQNGEKNENKRAYFNLLAISALETTVELSLSVREKVEKRIELLIPPKSRSTVNSLVAAGDLAVAYLPYSEDLTLIEADACLSVLGRIGSFPALRTMGTYASSSHKDIRSSLFRNLGTIPPKDVSQSGLAEKLLEALHLYIKGNCLYLTGSMVRALSYEDHDAWHNYCKDVEDLSIIDCNFVNFYLDNISSGIKTVRLFGNTIESMDIIARMRLEKLFVWNDKGIWPSFRPLSSLLPQGEIRLSSNNDYEWVPFFELGNIQGLEKLSFFSDSGSWLPDLDGIENIKSLESLHLGTVTGYWPDLSPLKDCNRLKRLRLSTTESDIPEVIIGMMELEHIQEIIIETGTETNSQDSNWERRRLDLTMQLPRATVTFSHQWTRDKLVEFSGVLFEDDIW